MEQQGLLDNKGWTYYDWTLEQLTAILKSLPGQYIIGGDFNTAMEDKYRKVNTTTSKSQDRDKRSIIMQYMNILKLAQKQFEIGDTNQYTYEKYTKDDHKAYSEACLDYFFVSNNMNDGVTDCKIIDKFKLYCNLVENTNLNNTNIMDKLVPILINPTKKNDSINFQDKIELYCNLYDKIPDTNRELLDKLKPFILNNTQDNNEDNVRDRFLIYSDLMQYKDSIGNDSLEKINSILQSCQAKLQINFLRCETAKYIILKLLLCMFH
jgi:hypothetical protein